VVVTTGGASWDGERPTSEVIAAVLAAHPDVVRHLEEAHEAAWRAVDPVLLELCRLRLAMLLGCEAELHARTEAAVVGGLEEATIAELARWPTSPRFGSRERACLTFCEQFVIDVANMPDEVAFAVSAELGPAGLRNFATALLVVEQRQRLRLAWGAIFDREAAA
jgi:alkylhydroperoxidase family enzyme